MTISERLTSLGFDRVGTGGNCEAAERNLTDGVYLLVTDGEAGFPTDADQQLHVGVYIDQHGDALWERNEVAPADLDAAVEALKTAWFLFECPCGSDKPYAQSAGRVFCRSCYALDQEIGNQR